MERLEDEISRVRHEQEIALLKEEVNQLKRKQRPDWLFLFLIIIGFAFLSQRQSADRNYRTASEAPHSVLTHDGLRSSFDPDSGFELTTSPRPGLTLRQGQVSYRIMIVQGKLIAEGTDRNGETIVKVLVDNEEAEQ